MNQTEPVSMEIDLPGEAATASLARALAALARRGDVFALYGELGAGKTVFARAFIRARAGDGGENEEVPSPSFTLLQTYEMAGATVYHFDFFRLSGPGETFELGIEEAFADGIALIEWPDRLGRLLPPDRLDVALGFAESEGARHVALTGRGGWEKRLAEAGLG